MRRVPIFAAVAALLAMTAAEAAELPEQIKQAGTVRLTVSSTYAPMEYRDPATNELTGLDIDLAITCIGCVWPTFGKTGFRGRS